MYNYGSSSFHLYSKAISNNLNNFKIKDNEFIIEFREDVDMIDIIEGENINFIRGLKKIVSNNFEESTIENLNQNENITFKKDIQTIQDLNNQTYIEENENLIENKTTIQQNDLDTILINADQANLVGFIYFPLNTINNYSFPNQYSLSEFIELYMNQKKKNKWNEKMYKKHYLNEKIKHYKVDDNNFVLDVKLLKTHIIIFEFPKINSFQEYRKYVKKIIPSSKEILINSNYNSVLSIDSYVKKNKELLNNFNINIQDEKFYNIDFLHSKIRMNIEKKNRSEYKNDLSTYIEYENNIKKHDYFFLNNLNFEDDKILKIYGNYLDLNTNKDSELNRFKWIKSSIDNGKLFFRKFINNNNILEVEYETNIKKKINELKDKIEELNQTKQENYNSLLYTPSIKVKVIYEKKIDKDLNSTIIYNNSLLKDGDKCLLIDFNNSSLFTYEIKKINNDLIWVNKKDILLELESGSFNETDVAKESKERKERKESKEKNKKSNKIEIFLNSTIKNKNILEDFLKINKLEDKIICNDLFKESIHFNSLKSETFFYYNNEKYEKEIFKINKKIKFLEEKLNLYNNLILEKSQKEYIDKNLEIDYQNIEFETLRNEEVFENKQNNLYLTKDKNVKENQNDLLRKVNNIKNKYSDEIRDKKLEKIINNYLREPRYYEDKNWLYSIETNEKILSKHWILKIKLTLQKEKYEEISKELKDTYGINPKGNSYWISFVDGDELFKIDDDTFEGYNNQEDGGVKVSTRTVVINKKESFLDKSILNLTNIEKKIHSILSFIQNEIYGLNLIPNKFFTENIKLTLLKEIYNYLINAYKSKLHKQYQEKKKYNSNFRNLDEYVDYIFETKGIYIMTCYCYYGVFFQTHIPILEKPNLISYKNTKYTLNGSPINNNNNNNNNDSNNENTFINYLIDIFYSNLNISLRSNSELVKYIKYFENKEYDELNEKFKKCYSLIGNELYITKLFNNWNNYKNKKTNAEIQIWSYFKPCFKYTKNKNNKQVLIEEFINKINKATEILNISENINEYYRKDNFYIDYFKNKLVKQNKTIHLLFHLHNKNLKKHYQIPFNLNIYPYSISNADNINIQKKYCFKNNKVIKKVYEKKNNCCLITGEKNNNLQVLKENDINNLVQNIKSNLIVENIYLNTNKSINKKQLIDEDEDDTLSGSAIMEETKQIKLIIELLIFIKKSKIIHNKNFVSILIEEFNKLFTKLKTNIFNKTSQYNEIDFNNILLDFSHNLEYSNEKNINLLIEEIYLKTYSFSNFKNIKEKLHSIIDFYYIIFEDNETNLYLKSFEKFIKYLSLIHNKKTSLSLLIPSSWQLSKDNIEIINNFSNYKLKNENNMIKLFSDKENNNEIIDDFISDLLKECRLIILKLKDLKYYSENYSKIIFEIYKIIFFEIINYLISIKENTNILTFLEIYLEILDNELIKSFYFTKKQIIEKRIKEEEEENNLYKELQMNKTEETRLVDYNKSIIAYN